jgi:hypothetical protein
MTQRKGLYAAAATAILVSSATSFGECLQVLMAHGVGVRLQFIDSWIDWILSISCVSIQNIELIDGICNQSI